MYALYTAPRTRGTRVTWTLEELRLDYQLRIHSPRDAEVKAVNPLRKLPVLVDGDMILTESAAICTFLADRHREVELSPPCPSVARARFDAWNYYTLTDLEAPLWNYSKNTSLYPEEVRVPEIIPACRREFERSSKALSQMLGDQEFLLGDAFSVADILCAHTLGWARSIKFELPANVGNYADRILGRPALKRAAIRERRAVDEAKSSSQDTQ
jgi:glutathione S-transferase